jgi:rhodanese-related sulfurtransferase
VATSVPTYAEEREGTFVGLFEPDSEHPESISPDELARRMQSDNPPVVLDVRARARYDEDASQIPGSVRILPDQVGDWAAAQPTARPVVVYCSCPADATSLRVARQLAERGFQAASLEGGYPAWLAANHPTEPKQTSPIILSERPAMQPAPQRD